MIPELEQAREVYQKLCRLNNLRIQLKNERHRAAALRQLSERESDALWRGCELYGEEQVSGR